MTSDETQIQIFADWPTSINGLLHYFTPCRRDPSRWKQLSTVAILGFQLYYVVDPLSFMKCQPCIFVFQSQYFTLLWLCAVFKSGNNVSTLILENVMGKINVSRDRLFIRIVKRKPYQWHVPMSSCRNQVKVIDFVNVIVSIFWVLYLEDSLLRFAFSMLEYCQIKKKRRILVLPTRSSFLEGKNII